MFMELRNAMQEYDFAALQHAEKMAAAAPVLDVPQKPILNVVKCDYLSFSTNTLTCDLAREIRENLPIPGGRFYRDRYECETYSMFAAPRMEVLPAIKARVKHEHLQKVLYQGLPKDATILRIDFAVDCDTLEKAKAYVIGKRTHIHHSDYDENEVPQGVTFYYGVRKDEIFERVYKKGEIWRYECELKPARAKTKIANKALYKRILSVESLLKLKPEIRQAYSAALRACTETGKPIKGAPPRVVTERRAIELQAIFELPYMSQINRKDFAQSLNDYERAYMQAIFKYKFKSKAPVYTWESALQMEWFTALLRMKARADARESAKNLQNSLTLT